jgi:hypothetical protein
MNKKKKGLLYYIYCALGEKSHPKCSRTADRVALIRLLITSQILITNFFIIANAIRHWNDVPSNVPETKKERILSTNSNVP